MKVVNTGTYEARLGDLIRTVRDVVRRRFITLAAVTAAVFALGVAITLSLTPTYTGITRVQIDPSRNPLMQRQNEAQAQLASEAIETEVAVINSHEMSRKVVQQLNLVNDPEFGGGPAKEGAEPVSPEKKLETVTRAVNAKLNAGRDRLTYIIAIRFNSKDPAKAAKIANAFATAYLDGKVGTKIGTAERQSQWYLKRQEELAAEVRAADQKVAQFQSEAGIVRGSSNQQGTIVDQQIAPLSLQLASAESIAAEARAKEISARQLVASKRPDAISDVRESATIQDLRRQRALLIQALEDVGGRYGERHPDYVKVKQQFNAIEAQIREEADRVIRSLAADAQAAEARAESLRATMRTLEEKQAAIAKASVIAASLQRDADSKHQAYDKMAQLALDSRQAAQNSIAQAEIIDSAKAPGSPSFPNKPLLFLLSLIAGLGVGAAVITTQELMVSGLRTIEEAEAEIGVPLIAAIPNVKNEPRPADLLLKKPTSQFAEALRNARASIIGVRSSDRPRVIALTSALPSEGKTTTALSLARTMALNGDRTLIVDCDIRRALLRRLSEGDTSMPGLVELLKGEAKVADAIQPGGIDNLDQIIVREPLFTSENFFGNDLMPSLLDELSKQYDAIILDLPPLVGLADGRFLAALADAVVLVMKWDATPKSAINSAAGWLKSDGANLVGGMFTMVDTGSNSVGAYYYYSKQYSGYYQES